MSENKIPYNFFAIPYYIQDFVLPTLSLSERTVFQYVLRRTLGFDKRGDYIAAKTFMTGMTNGNGEILDLGTGISKPTLLKALRSLQDQELIHSQLECSNTICSWNMDPRNPIPDVCPVCGTFAKKNRMLRRWVEIPDALWNDIISKDSLLNQERNLTESVKELNCISKESLPSRERIERKKSFKKIVGDEKASSQERLEKEEEDMPATEKVTDIPDMMRRYRQQQVMAAQELQLKRKHAQERKQDAKEDVAYDRQVIRKLMGDDDG